MNSVIQKSAGSSTPSILLHCGDRATYRYVGCPGTGCVSNLCNHAHPRRPELHLARGDKRNHIRRHYSLSCSVFDHGFKDGFIPRNARQGRHIKPRDDPGPWCKTDRCLMDLKPRTINQRQNIPGFNTLKRQIEKTTAAAYCLSRATRCKLGNVVKKLCRRSLQSRARTVYTLPSRP